MIDLRSDAITQPTPAMWDAMRNARLGWAFAKEDPTVNELETYVADLSEKEASVFLPTGTMANLVALMTHTQRGDQVILEATSHILWCEEWSLAYICGVVQRTIRGTRGQMDPGEVEGAILERTFAHRPKTSLVCLENTHNFAGGVIASPEQISSIAHVAHKYAIPVHLDGARIFNACAALKKDVYDFISNVDTVTINLNKGLSAPFGALLCGSKDFIEKCKVNVKRIGAGNVHQAGIFAAAGLVALKTMLPQIAEDNRRAKVLAEGIMYLNSSKIKVFPADTNIVMVSVDKSFTSADVFVQHMVQHNVLASTGSDELIRFVTHRHVSDEDIQQVVNTIQAIITQS
jgi:threonine aldolase